MKSLPESILRQRQLQQLQDEIDILRAELERRLNRDKPEPNDDDDSTFNRVIGKGELREQK